jgi:prepilin-type N-terminal cleavage/methylation domain-containing protein
VADVLVRARRGPAAQGCAGLTLIELMVALVISGMLLTATMSVIGGLWRANARDQSQHEASARSFGIQTLMTNDMLNATEYLVTGQQCQLKTHYLLDESALAPQRVPATVSYQVRTVGGHNWLVRSQQPEVLGKRMDELVCSGVQSVTMKAVAADNADSAAAPPPDTFQPMPAGMNVQVNFDAPGRAPLLWTVWRY